MWFTDYSTKYHEKTPHENSCSSTRGSVIDACHCNYASALGFYIAVTIAI